jgi:hypothetical protein
MTDRTCRDASAGTGGLDTLTAPLPPAAVSVMHRLGWKLSAPDGVVRAVTRFEVASARTAELSAVMDERDLSPAEFTALEFAQDVIRESRKVLAMTGMLHLIGGGV